MGVKLGFLEQNKLGLFSKMIGTDLRNKVAHLKFEIAENGIIRSNRKEIQIDEEIKDLRMTVYAFRLFLINSGTLDYMKKQAALQERKLQQT